MNGVIFLPEGKRISVEGDVQEVSDGCHTFKELYQQRSLLLIALMKSYPRMSWRSFRDDQGNWNEKTFLAGMKLPTGDVSFHLGEEFWYMLQGIETRKKSPPFDGHTASDALDRIESWILDYSF